MKKRILTGLLSFILVFSLVACGTKKIPLAEDLTPQQITINQLAATDAVGRSFSSVNKFSEKLQFGLFYFLWLNQDTPIYNITELMETQKGFNMLFDPSDPDYTMENAIHYFAEPLYGYYHSEDPWVIRRHIELLTMAGIDFLYFDATNGMTYESVLMNIMPIISEYRQKGWDAPQIVFYTFGMAKKTVQRLYDEIYSKNFYPESWYMVDGKPMIIVPDSKMVAINPPQWDQGYDHFSQEVKDFFYFRFSEWPGYDPVEGGLPWIDMMYPQTLSGGDNYSKALSVSVAQHNGAPFGRSGYSDGRWYDNFALYNMNSGRGYSNVDGVNSRDRIAEGSNFEEQFQTIDLYSDVEDLEYIMITGWNEWTVSKTIDPAYFPEQVFVDSFNDEFSRDVEMMKGGYGDNYYLQMMRNIRKYSTEKNDAVIDIKSPSSFGMYLTDEKWSDYGMTYLDFTGDAVSRNFRAASSAYPKYEDYSNRNDISKVKVLNDSKNLYFLVETVEDIIYSENGLNWMNIMIDTDDENVGFEGYDYIINRFPSKNGKTSLEKASGNGYQFEYVNSLNYRIAGNRMVVQIPISALKLKNNDFSIRFKVADNVTNPEDIMSYYSYGDSAPIGRLNYEYTFKK